MNIYVLTAERALAVEIQRENTALNAVISIPAGRAASVMSSYEQRLINYHLSMSVIRTMLKRGLISRKEYDNIDTIIAKKHGVSLCSIFRKIP